MDKVELMSYLDRNYLGRDDILCRLPLRFSGEAIWQEILGKRQGTAVYLPLKNADGDRYWYNQTEKMLESGDKIFEYVMSARYTDFRQMVMTESVRNELVYTNFAEGVSMKLDDAFAFLNREREPENTNELLLLNNNKAYSFMVGNLYNQYEERFLGSMAYLLLDGIVERDSIYRSTDGQDIPASQIGALNLKPGKYRLPKAKDIPELMRELCTFLGDEEIHPLIKAGAAHAWILACRPYSDGNERFARLLSTCILLRAGYDFFTDISLSSLIVRDHYNYFKQMANIMKHENGGDMTYFIEYYIDLLTRAITEKNRPPGSRKNSDEAGYQKLWISSPEIKQEERRNNKAADVMELSAGEEERTETKPTEANMTEESLEEAEYTKIVALAVLSRLKKGTETFTAREIAEETGLTLKRTEKELEIITISDTIVREAEVYRIKLRYTYTQSEILAALKQQKSISVSDNSRYILQELIDRLNDGCPAFRNAEISSALNRDELVKLIWVLRKRGLLIKIGKNSVKTVFAFNCPVQKWSEMPVGTCVTAADFEWNREKPSDQLLDAVNTLLDDNFPARRRCGEAVVRLLHAEIMHPSGDVLNALLGADRQTGINRLENRGIIKRDGKNWNICRYPEIKPENLRQGKRGLVGRIYEEFGDKQFSRAMAANALKMHDQYIYKTLKEMYLLKIVGESVEEDGSHWFHFLVNPAECFGDEQKKAVG